MTYRYHPQHARSAHAARQPRLLPEWIALAIVFVLIAACASAWAMESGIPPHAGP